MADWTLTWLGHASFRLEVGGQVFLIDPWLEGNPSFNDADFDTAVAGAQHILLTHGHFDHTASVAAAAKATGARVAAVFELASYFGAQGVENTLPFHKGGTIDCGGVAVTMVHAVHSSSLGEAGSPVYMGGEAGFMIGLDGETLYIMGDTDVHSDMALFQELHAPDYAIVPIGGHFTMDPHRAAFACKKFFDLKAAIPSHYQTFPMLAQSADAFVEKMAPTKVIVPTVMEPVTLA